MARSQWSMVMLILVVILVAIVSLVAIPHVGQPPLRTVTPTQAASKADRCNMAETPFAGYTTKVHLLTMNGTVRNAYPVSYLRSPEFFASGNQLKIVLRMSANQQIESAIEIVRVVGHYTTQPQRGEKSDVRIFGLYPCSLVAHKKWDFRNEYINTVYASLGVIPSHLTGNVPLGLEVEIFIEGPSFSSNPEFLVYWQIEVYDMI